MGPESDNQQSKSEKSLMSTSTVHNSIALCMNYYEIYVNFICVSAQFRPGKRQLARDFTDALILPKNWVPLFKVYKPLSPIQSMISLQESPICRRKKIDLDIDLRNNESVI